MSALVWLVSRMRSVVGIEEGLLGKGPLANVACVRFGARMGASMAYKGTTLAEGLVAKITAVRSLAGMRAHVNG